MTGESRGTFGDDEVGQPEGTAAAGSFRRGDAGRIEREEGADPYRQAGRAAERVSAAAREEASELADALIRQVEQRPLRALATLVSIGFIAGWMVAR